MDCFIAPWTQNQTLTITEQIARGVRWFDLRISYSPEDHSLYTSHTYLTTNALADVFAALQVSALASPLYILLRVDYQQRDQCAVIAPLLAPLIDASISPSLLFYCDDGTVTHPAVRSTGLMPTVSLWDAGSIEECERRFQNLEQLFQEQTDGPFLFPKERMLLLDYSTSAPLWYTDAQQVGLLKKYRGAVEAVRLTILAGNHVEHLMDVWSESK